MASGTPRQGRAGWGGRYRSRPVGGVAYGIPRNLRVWAVRRPRIGPVGGCTTSPREANTASATPPIFVPITTARGRVISSSICHALSVAVRGAAAKFSSSVAVVCGSSCIGVSHAGQQLDTGAGHGAVGGGRRGTPPVVVGADDHQHRQAQRGQPAGKAPLPQVVIRSPARPREGAVGHPKRVLDDGAGGCRQGG